MPLELPESRSAASLAPAVGVPSLVPVTRVVSCLVILLQRQGPRPT